MDRRKFKIIIVEDDKFYNKMLTEVIKNVCDKSDFSQDDFEIRSFLSGKECVEDLDKETDLVILDYYLDGYDIYPYNGFDVIKVINNECTNCKVIVVTGQRDEKIKEKLLYEGVYAYIDKYDNANEQLQEALLKLLREEHLVS